MRMVVMRREDHPCPGDPAMMKKQQLVSLERLGLGHVTGSSSGVESFIQTDGRIKKKRRDKRGCSRIWTALRSASLSSSAASLSFYTFSADTLRLFQLLQLEPGPLPFIHALILTSPEEALFFKLNKPETTKRLKPGWLILNVRKETWNKESQTVIICTDNFVVTLPLCATWLKMCLNIRVWALIQGI